MMQSGMWFGVSKRDPRVVGLFSRHYSARSFRTIGDWLKFGIVAPGESVTLMTPDCSALFVWLKQQYVRNKQTGVNCAVFRNEGGGCSSLLILEAEQFAWKRWPGERLYTYVDPSKVQSANPGYCFKKAGWNLVRNEEGKPMLTTKGLLILEKYPEVKP